MKTTTDAQKFLNLRNQLQQAKSYDEALKIFQWPTMTKFNWASEYFDEMAKGNNKTALIYADTEGNERQVSFEQMRQRSNQVANFLQAKGFKKGDRALIMMDTSVEIYELFLAIMKLGGTIIPASTLLSPDDISDRITRGNISFVIAHHKFIERIDQAGEVLNSLKALINVPHITIPREAETYHEKHWIKYEDANHYETEFIPDFITFTSDILFMFFTSGTTSQPKLVIHPYHYPVGHLTTMYWLDLQPDDIHYNISSPGWAKFAWSSFMAPWNAGATIFTFHYAAFDPEKTLQMIEKHKITSLCGPLSVWKLFVLKNFEKYNFNLKKIVSAGEPLNPEITKKVEQITGLQLREGYGQTETTALIFTPKGMTVPQGSMGKASPGYEIKIMDDKLDEVPPRKDGQIAVRTYPYRPLGLLKGYDDEQKNMEIFKGSWYLTGDTAYRDENGFFFFIGRSDDVFKSLDYRISPFEVESEIMEHEAVLEVGVIPTIDHLERIVPKAFIVLKPGFEKDAATALTLFKFIRGRMAPYKRPRSIEFMEAFPKTISSKVMRKDLRKYDEELKNMEIRGKYEFLELDFADELQLRKRK